MVSYLSSKDGEWIETNEIAEQLRLSETTSKRLLRDLRAAGRVAWKLGPQTRCGRTPYVHAVSETGSCPGSFSAVALASVFGGYTFPPPGFVHPEPSRTNIFFGDDDVECEQGDPDWASGSGPGNEVHAGR